MQRIIDRSISLMIFARCVLAINILQLAYTFTDPFQISSIQDYQNIRIVVPRCGICEILKRFVYIHTRRKFLCATVGTGNEDLK